MAIEVHIMKKFSGFCLQVDFQSRGGIMGILGASGCGKSMTLKCIAGIETPDEGRIVVNGEVFFDSEKNINLSAQKRKTGFLFQNYALFPHMTVSQNIASGIRQKKSKWETQELVQQYLVRMQLENLENSYSHQLSGGQQQRAALARMLIGEPSIILLDEPFSALDGYLKEVLQQELMEQLEGLSQDVLLVTHSRDEIYKFCQNLTMMHQGRSIRTGDTKEIFRHPRLLEAARLTGCKNFSPIEKMDSHRVYAKDWGIELITAEEVGDDITHVGIRAHWLSPSERDEENSVRIKLVKCVEAPFEYQYYVQNAVGWDTKTFLWKKNKNERAIYEGEDFPTYLRFPPQEIMLLK